MSIASEAAPTWNDAGGPAEGGPPLAEVDLAQLICIVGGMDLRWRLSHARGYIELGMFKEAAAELDAIGAADADSIDVLAAAARQR